MLPSGLGYVCGCVHSDAALGLTPTCGMGVHISSVNTNAPLAMASHSLKSPSQDEGLHVTTMRACRRDEKYLWRGCGAGGASLHVR